MSYCRKNGEDSEVYVIGTDSALECCGCSLYKRSFLTRAYSSMLLHLKEHRDAGEKVPVRARTRLRAEQKVYKDIYPAKRHTPLPKNRRKTKVEAAEVKLYSICISRRSCRNLS